MNEELVAALASKVAMDVGSQAADRAIVDSIVITLLLAFPPLATDLANTLDGLAEMARQRLAPEEPEARQAFDSRFADMRAVLGSAQERLR
jgi:hypothetical protein